MEYQTRLLWFQYTLRYVIGWLMSCITFYNVFCLFFSKSNVLSDAQTITIRYQESDVYILALILL